MSSLLEPQTPAFELAPQIRGLVEIEVLRPLARERALVDVLRPENGTRPKATPGEGLALLSEDGSQGRADLGSGTKRFAHAPAAAPWDSKTPMPEGALGRSWSERVLAHCVGIEYNERMQYTIRNIPKRLDQALRQLARTQNKSLNQVAIETLTKALGTAEEPVRHRDLGDLAGKWVEDPDFEQAMADQDTVDEAIWK